MMLLLVGVLASQAVDAGPRHQGFFLRADVDLGYFKSGTPSLTYSGPGGGFGIAMGGSVADNLALYGQLFGSKVNNPSISAGLGTASTNNFGVSMVGLGGGLTYYFMPINIFVAGTLGVGRVYVSNGPLSFHTQLGPVGRLGMGWEWRISRGWGIGVAAYLNLGSQNDYGAPEAGPARWTTVSPLLSLSVTFY